jgi:PASTA domain
MGVMMDFKNPLAGLPKPARYAVIFGSVGVGGYMVYRHHSTTGSWNPFRNPSISTAAGSATGTDPITGMPYSQDAVIDPITSLGYLAEAQQYGSVAAAEASVSAYGQSTATGSGIPVNPASPQPTGSTNTTVGTNVYTSNSAWAQAVTAGLTDVGYDGPTVAAALGLYETGQPMTAAQAKIISTAIAEYGPAPTGNLQIIIAPDKKPGATMVGVPNVLKESQSDAFRAISAAGLKPTGTKDVPGKTLTVETQSPKAGTQVTKGTTVKLTSKVVK